MQHSVHIYAFTSASSDENKSLFERYIGERPKKSTTIWFGMILCKLHWPGIMYSFRIEYLNLFEALIFSTSLRLSIVYFPKWNAHAKCIYYCFSYFETVSLYIHLPLLLSIYRFFALYIIISFCFISSFLITYPQWFFFFVVVRNPWVVQSIDKIAQIKQRPKQMQNKNTSARARSNLNQMREKKKK